MTGAIERWVPRFMLLLLVVAAIGVDVGAITLGDAQITLQSTRYYKTWDLTRFVYRVKLPPKPSGSDSAYWILGIGGCVTDDALDPATSEFEWVEDPFHGMRFELTKKNQTFYIWLEGRWDIAPTTIAVTWSEDDKTHTGQLDGPACEEASIAVEVADGSVVTFPALFGAGTHEAADTTNLRISSTSQGWALGHSLELSIPEGASYEIVERVFQVLFQPYETLAGTVDVGVAYALIVSEEDFIGLPEGTYTITVTFTVSTD